MAKSLASKMDKVLDTHSGVELTFTSKPAPDDFRELLLQLRKRVNPEKWFLSQEDAIIAGVLFDLNFSRPRRAVIEIANGCNLKCDFCWTHSPLRDAPANPKWLKKTLEPEKVISALDELAEFGTIHKLEFCAVGDPLYHPDIWKFIAYAKAKGFYLQLSTNGTMLYPAKWDEYCAKDPVDELAMNISSGDRDTYASIHNVSPKIYDQLIVNLKHIAEMRKKTGRGLSMRWINIITDKNIGNIRQIIEAAAETGADYVDLRNVWVHKEFQKDIGVSRSVLQAEQKNLQAAQARLQELGLDSNFDDFYRSLFGAEAQHA